LSIVIPAKAGIHFDVEALLNGFRITCAAVRPE
jgi:hypothetical protein